MEHLAFRLMFSKRLRLLFLLQFNICGKTWFQTQKLGCYTCNNISMLCINKYIILTATPV